MKKIQSTCNICSIGCNLDFYVEDNKITKVSPTKNYPVNKGLACIKGLNLDKEQIKGEVTKKPLLRDESGNRNEIEWDEAFELFAKKMSDIQSKYGTESVAFISTGQITTEEIALLGHVARNFMKIPGDGNTRQCMATSVVAHKQSFGFDAPPYTLKDAELSDTIIFIGSNPAIAHPVFWARVRKNKDAKIIVIDPRKSETAKYADEWIDIKPKGDLTLLYTLANVLIENNWIDKEYIKQYSEGFEEFKNHVSKFTPENSFEKIGISKERILNLAKTIHDGKRVSFWWTMGVNQSYEGVRTAQAIINLAVMTGNIGRPGTGANSLTGQSNAMGSRAFSNTTGLFGGGDFDDILRRKAVSKALEVNESLLATKATIPYNVIVEKAIAGEIKGLWVIGTNPRHSWTNNSEFKKAAENLEFLVVQDIYADTHTSKLSYLFLPSVPIIKKEGTLINLERRVSKVNPVIPKEEDELTDYEIIFNIGKALGMGKLLDNWKTPKDTFELLKKCSKGMPCDITGITYELLEGEDRTGSGGIQWPFRESEALEEDERRLYENGEYYTPSKKVKFLFGDISKNPVAQYDEFPYILNSGRGSVGQWHTSIRTREIPDKLKTWPEKAYVYMNPKLASKLKINENENVIIESINNSRAKFDVKINDMVKEDQLYAPIHYIETNSLTPSVYDPFSKEPSFKTVAIKILKK
ncbi:molybdopterin oxidoreductase family protein [Romboutsia sp. 1001713B170207_170306_H8]|uniref:molybdopterin oxidoreductase family protein n=1 Tax=Romboutsia sp. 1001713B170207_170306_H8 TaxID=2787112 RepID=UPI001899F00C|nr:molybdopterin oxidoreductase family protein [Romboutsia sp. 1001713B170207_170306_H8]